MSALTRRHTWMMAVVLLGVIAVACAVRPERAEAEILLLSSNQFTSVQGSAGATLVPNVSSLRASMGPAALPESEMFLHIQLPLGRKILGVFVCYRTENARTYIAATRVSSFALPGSSTLLGDDSTHQTSTTDACYAAPIPAAGVPVPGVVVLRLALRFGAVGDGILFGLVAVSVE